MEERLAKRKLDALKRGIHRVGNDQPLPYSMNIVGIGKAGGEIVEEVLKRLPESGPKLTALVIDIGEQDLRSLREAAAGLTAERASVEIVALDIPSEDELAATLGQYGEFLRLEYPWYSMPPSGVNWLPQPRSAVNPEFGIPRALAKAVYGRAYYDGDRAMRTSLRRFAAEVAATDAQPVACVVFGIGGGTGSGIGIDLARHLSTIALGRAALTVGIGILPCAGDRPNHLGGGFFAALNELDCLGDEVKNEGVVKACGELFRNPFTAGFIVVPQQQVWEQTRDLAQTHQRVDREIAELLSARGGANLMEVLRLLNWVAAPSTQHSAARTPWGSKWIHMLGFADLSGSLNVGPRHRQRIGLRETYKPEYIETRVATIDAKSDALAGKLAAAFAPDVPPQTVEGGRAGSVQFILPCIEKFDLDLFYASRDAYDHETGDDRILDHSMLLERGVVLSEPSTQLEGMAGASLNDGEGWVAVPYEALHGRKAQPESRAKPKAKFMVV